MRFSFRTRSHDSGNVDPMPDVDVNQHLDRIDHQHDKGEQSKDCTICVAEAWVKDLQARGMPLNEIRNMHLLASSATAARNSETKKKEGYVSLIMLLVKRLGGAVIVLPEDFSDLRGRLLQEDEGEGLKFSIMEPSAGRGKN